MSHNKRTRRPETASAFTVTNSVETTDPRKNASSDDRHSVRGFFAYFKNPSHWWLIALIAFLSLGVFGAGLKYLEDSAREERARQKQNPLVKNESLLASLKPFSPSPTPTPALQASKDYVYAGSRLLAVEDAGASAVPPADLAVWRPSNGNWYCLGGAGGSQGFTVSWGMNGDSPTPGDYDNDGKTDLAIFRPSSGTWWIVNSSNNTYYTVSLGFVGRSGDLTAQADFDGDGKTDPALFRPSNQAWYIFYSSTGNLGSAQFGATNDAPAAADYDGDGKADIATWRDAEAKFYIYSSSLSQMQTQTLGNSGSKAVPADYDGDGKADYAIRTGNNWIIRQRSNGQTQTLTWYLSTDDAVQNDYDGDGKVDVAVWRPSGKAAGSWFIRNSHDGSIRIESWGMAGDIPVPALYRR